MEDLLRLQVLIAHSSTTSVEMGLLSGTKQSSNALVGVGGAILYIK